MVIGMGEVVSMTDGKARLETKPFYLDASIRTITDEPLDRLREYSPLLVNDYHLKLARSMYDFRQEVGEDTLADHSLVRFNVPTQMVTVLEYVGRELTVNVPLGFLEDLYRITNISLEITLTYAFKANDLEMRHFHTDVKTLIDLYNLKADYLARIIDEDFVNYREVQNYLVRQLFYLKQEAIEDVALNSVWLVASELASPSINGVLEFFADDENEYDEIQKKFQLIEADELYDILRKKMNVDSIFETVEEWMDATEKWLKEDKEKIQHDTKYAYANIILNRFNYFLSSE